MKTMKFKIKDEKFCEDDYVRVYAVMEFGSDKGREVELDKISFLHKNRLEAIEYFEEIIKDLKGLEDE